MNGDDWTLIKHSNKRAVINEHLKNLRRGKNDLTGRFVVIQQIVNTGQYFKGPINIICEIHCYEQGKRISMDATNVFYTVSELETRGFKLNDYITIANMLISNKLPSAREGKLPTASELDM